ncbi:hypothetical protein [Catenuloplanes japonicus]|uniref:hypothetical protein n=1 Tax=Catenuloplanes japonicus TaxID=33876 RepID=UPI00052608BA|nr:hypothetical protein [Catenuloplanes japonicus]
MTTEQMTPDRPRTGVVEGTLMQPATVATTTSNAAPFAPAAVDPGVSDTSAGWGAPAKDGGRWTLKTVLIALTVTALVAGGGGFLAGQAFGGGTSGTGTTQQGPGGGGFPGGGQGGFPGGGQNGGGQFPGGQNGGTGDSTQDGAPQQNGTAQSGQEATA